MSTAAVRSARPGYAVARGVGAALTAVVVLGAAASSVPDMLRQTGTQSAELPSALLPADESGTVVVRSTAGDVRVVEVAAGEASVDAELTWSLSQPELTVTEAGDDLVVSAPCQLNVGTCWADLTVGLPEGTPVRVESTVGDVAVRASGPVEVTATTGAIRVEGAPTTVTARSTLGSITVAPGRPPPASVSLRTTLGDATVQLPAEEAYAVTARSQQGEESVDVDVDPGSPYRVDVESTLGTIRVERTWSP